MQNTTIQNSKLLFRCRMLCVSLVAGSLILSLIFIVYYIGYISIEAAVLSAMSVTVAAAIYEIILLFQITRYE